MTKDCCLELLESMEKALECFLETAVSAHNVSASLFCVSPYNNDKESRMVAEALEKNKHCILAIRDSLYEIQKVKQKLIKDMQKQK